VSSSCRHDDHHAPRRDTDHRRRLSLTLLLVLGYMVAEVIGGWWTNSLALLADAGHMLSDAASLGLSLFALWIAGRPPNSRQTFGYYRAEILAALANGGALVAVSVMIFVEAVHRFREPAPVAGGTMMVIAVGGLLVNLVGLALLDHGHHENLNIRGAWLHVLTDALGSVGAVVAGLLVWAFGWYWSDPAASTLIGLLVIYSSWRLLAESLSVLMENAPRGIDVDEVRQALAAIPGVLSVHDLHVWTITIGLDSLSAHLITETGHADRGLLRLVRAMLQERFGITHVTIQIEPPEWD
jgi:cobalt-zinc-cadmium efflux system protein